MLELAGLLNDLGMLVPDKILHKPGKLSEAENFIVWQHSYNTHEILKNIKGFEDISMWAAQHLNVSMEVATPFATLQKTFQSRQGLLL